MARNQSINNYEDSNNPKRHNFYDKQFTIYRDYSWEKGEVVVYMGENSSPVSKS